MLRRSLCIALFVVLFGIVGSTGAEAKHSKTKHAKEKPSKPKVEENCFVKNDDGSCHGGVFVRNKAGVNLCKVGRSLEYASFTSRHICETGGGDTGPLPKNLAKPCYYRAKGGEKCVAGVLDLENSGICFLDSNMESRFFSDSKCTEAVTVTACWTYRETQAGTAPTCDSDHAGKIVDLNGLFICQVGSQRASRDFFFDNQCDEGSVGWNGGKPLPGKVMNPLAPIDIASPEGKASDCAANALVLNPETGRCETGSPEPMKTPKPKSKRAKKKKSAE